MCNEGLLKYVTGAGPLHLGDNPSRHAPIMLRLNLGEIQARLAIVTIPRPRRPAWYKAKIEHIEAYTDCLDSKVKEIDLPASLKCCDPLCTSKTHKNERDLCLLELMSSINEAGKQCIPMTGCNDSKHSESKTPFHAEVPGWNQEVKPMKDSANFWYSVWRSAGRPVNCELHNVMKHTRNKYHHSVRKVKLLSKAIKANNLLQASLNGNCHLLKEMKNEKQAGKQRQPDHVDGAIGGQIAEQFADVYSDLYNSANDTEGLNTLRQKLQLLYLNNITPEVVKEAVERLKSNKNDVSGDFSSDSLLNSPDSVFKLLADIIKSSFIHGDFSADILVCAFLPLLKGALKDDTKSDNYRAIALSSLILKVIDNIILIIWGDILASDWLQFGFKAGTGTSPCSWAVLEVVSLYHRQKSSVKAACLDLSKAFDKCLFSVLFLKILDRGVPAIVVRGLLAMYSMQRCHVRWTASKEIFRIFTVSNGTKQGSCLSHCLFAIYMDDLLQILRRSGAGCYVLDIFAGAFFYADDLIILAPTRQALQEMLTISEQYATKHNMVFSVHEDPKKSKSKCVHFNYGREEEPEKLVLYEKPLPWLSLIHI